MIKELRNVVYLLTIFFAIFFVTKFIYLKITLSGAIELYFNTKKN